VKKRTSTSASATQIREFDSARVRVLPGQPRKRFRNIPELAESIKSGGQHTPGIVTLIEGDSHHDAELVDGERRLRACQLAKLPFRAEVRTGLTYNEKFMLSLGANFGREDHSATEIASALKRAVEGGATPEGLSKALGKSITWVWQHINLNDLHPVVFAMLEEAEHLDEKSFLNFSTAQNLLKLPADEQKMFAQRIKKGDFRSLEELRREILSFARAKGISVSRRTRSPQSRINDFSTLVQKTVHRVGIYEDMPASELNTMIEGASPVELRTILTTLKGLIASMKGLCETIEHRSARMKVDHEQKAPRNQH